jgi:ppGpp synthetase/RelA/SpoT-type nucleotidyltranferase
LLLTVAGHRRSIWRQPLPDCNAAADPGSDSAAADRTPEVESDDRFGELHRPEGDTHCDFTSGLTRNFLRSRASWNIAMREALTPMHFPPTELLSDEHWTRTQGGPPITLSHPNITISDALYAAEQIAQRLQTLSDSLAPSSLRTQFYSRVRVKAHESIREKVKRKQQGSEDEKPKPLYSFREMTDIVGLRLVTLYDDELTSAVKHVVDLVKAGQQLTQPLFKPGLIWHGFFEARFFRRSPEPGDIYLACHKALDEIISLDSSAHGAPAGPIAGRSTPEEPRPQRYSSAHMIFYAISYGKKWRLLVPVEFQIRTAVEDVWAEINHQLLYKIRNSYVWNREFERSYLRAQGASRDLKKIVNNLPDAIIKFREESKGAQRQIDSFAEPDVHETFSLCIALFLNLGDQNSALFSEELQSYKRIVQTLPSSRSRRNSAAKLADSIKLLAAVRNNFATRSEELEREKERVEERGEDSGNVKVDLELVRQRLLLSEFEMLRLEILIIVMFKYRYKEGNLSRLTMHIEWERACVEIYGRLCQFRAEDKLLIRPLAVIFYWKYLIAQNFDANIAKTNIVNAYEEIKFDRSIPDTSVYKVLIPRHLANTFFLEVGDGIETIRRQGGDPRVMHGLASELKAKLIQAIGYALEAFSTYQEKHPNRGDILFGFERASPIKDAHSVLTIYAYFHTQFGSLITESNQVDEVGIRKVLEHLTNQTLSEFVTPDEASKVAETVQQIKRLMELASPAVQ